MKQIFERLMVPDYDTTLIREGDRIAVGNDFRKKNKWFMGMFYLLVASFALVVITYMLGVDGKISPKHKSFFAQGTVGISVMTYFGSSSALIGFLWWAVGRYAENTKEAAVRYFHQEVSYYAKRMKEAQVTTLKHLEFKWNALPLQTRREAIIAAYEQYRSKNTTIHQAVTDTFLELLLLENPGYSQLPGWIKPELCVYDWFYYWDKEKHDRAEHYLKLLAFT